MKVLQGRGQGFEWRVQVDEGAGRHDLRVHRGAGGLAAAAAGAPPAGCTTAVPRLARALGDPLRSGITIMSWRTVRCPRKVGVARERPMLYDCLYELFARIKLLL